MRRLPSWITGIILGAILHVDWHLARPLHHGLSLDFSYHWAVTAAAFAIVGCVLARRWPDERWRIGGAGLAIGIVLSQLVEPVVTVAVYEHRFGYDVGRERLIAFTQSLVVGTLAYALTLWRCVAPHYRRTASA